MFQKRKPQGTTAVVAQCNRFCGLHAALPEQPARVQGVFFERRAQEWSESAHGNLYLLFVLQLFKPLSCVALSIRCKRQHKSWCLVKPELRQPLQDASKHEGPRPPRRQRRPLQTHRHVAQAVNMHGMHLPVCHIPCVHCAGML